MIERILIFVLRAHFLLTGECVRFMPDRDGVCTVCRWQPVLDPTPWHLRPEAAAALDKIYADVATTCRL